MSDPLRIAYVLKIFPKVSETFIVNELAELRRRGCELRILSLLPPREPIRHHLVAECELEHMTCYEPSEFKTAVEEFAPNLLHAHFATESTAAARELAAEQGVPFTFTSHGYDIYRKPPPDYGKRAQEAAAVITVSQANASYILQTFGVPAEKLHVIPCGIDLELFRPLTKGVAKTKPRILCVARQVIVKNLPLLLKACALLRERNVDFECVLVGDGPCRAELERMQSELQLREAVRLVGAADHKQVLQHWQDADVGVLCSDSEGMPVSLMEAAACAVPVVATKVGGVPELVEDGVTGLLCPTGDSTALAAALERLLSDPVLRQSLGSAARARAERRFSLKHQVDLLLTLWRGLLTFQRP